LTGAVATSLDKKDEVFRKLKKEYPELEILGPDINLSKAYYYPVGDMKIISPFVSLKGVGQKVSEEIISKRDSVKNFKSIDHILSTLNSGSKNTMSIGLIDLFIDNNVIKEQDFGSKTMMKVEAKRYFSMKNMIPKKPKSSLFEQRSLF
jgi:DNA polymerase III alpha subunit